MGALTAVPWMCPLGALSPYFSFIVPFVLVPGLNGTSHLKGAPDKVFRYTSLWHMQPFSNTGLLEPIKRMVPLLETYK